MGQQTGSFHAALQRLTASIDEVPANLRDDLDTLLIYMWYLEDENRQLVTELYEQAHGKLVRDKPKKMIRKQKKKVKETCVGSSESLNVSRLQRKRLSP